MNTECFTYYIKLKPKIINNIERGVVCLLHFPKELSSLIIYININLDDNTYTIVVETNR